jgi:futalosine hydrolase
MSYPDRSFKTLFEEGLMSKYSPPFTNGCLHSAFQMPVGMNLPEAKGITVNTCSGDSELIKSRKEHFNAEVESMEGAAVAYVCLNEKIEFVQIRAVSNLIEPRNKERWDIEKATHQLADCLFELIVLKCGF